MHEICFDTAPLPEAQRFDYWHSVVCSTFVYLELQPAARSGFQAALRARRCGEVNAVRVSGSAQRVTRSARMIAQDPRENLIVMFHARGNADVEQDGRRIGMAPGECVLLDSRRPYRIDLSDGFEQIVLNVPLAPLQRSRLAIESLTSQAFAVSDAAGRLLRATLRELLGSDDPKTSSLGAVAIELLCLALQRPEASEPEPARARWRYERAVESVRRLLASSVFDVLAMAREQGISLRQLQKVFMTMGQRPGEYLLEQRLLAARQALLQPSAREPSVTRIAFDCGFNDSGYFGKRYRKRFGRSPTEDRDSPDSQAQFAPIPAPPRA